MKISIFYMFMALSLLACASVFAETKTTAQSQPSLPSSARFTPAVSAVAQALPSVVSIGTENLVRVNDGYDMFFHEFYGRIRRPRHKLVRSYNPLGSGIVISDKGLIITNLHVVRRANNLEVRLWNGEAFNATIIGFDEPNDLAILKITDDVPDNKLKPATFAKPDDLFLCETVMTIGNPFGLDHSVSMGVLSALNRSYSDEASPFDDLLQTDAAINPGNSGGPLINLDGQVIGINQAIRQGAAGIGFAIPTKRIERFASHWLLPSRFGNTYLGLDGNKQLKDVQNGVQVEQPVPGSPLAKAGLKAGDVITHVNGRKIERLFDLGISLWNVNKDTPVNVTLSDGRTLTVRPELIPDSVLVNTRLGISVQQLTPSLCEALDLPKDWSGLVVNEVVSEADFVNHQAEWRKTLKRGDIVLKIDNMAVKTEKDLADYLRKKRSGQIITLIAFVYDPGQSNFVLVRFNAYLK